MPLERFSGEVAPIQLISLEAALLKLGVVFHVSSLSGIRYKKGQEVTTGTIMEPGTGLPVTSLYIQIAKHTHLPSLYTKDGVPVELQMMTEVQADQTDEDHLDAESLGFDF
jgi:hypothetical protein